MKTDLTRFDTSEVEDRAKARLPPEAKPETEMLEPAGKALITSSPSSKAAGQGCSGANR